MEKEAEKTFFFDFILSYQKNVVFLQSLFGSYV